MLNTSGAGPWLEADQETIGLLRDEHLWLDLDQFQRRLADCEIHGHSSTDVCRDCLTSLTEAVELYRDDFMAGFTLRDSPAFDDWQFFQTDNLRRELAGALEKLVRGHSAQGQFNTAIDYAQRWLALDPLHEPAHRAALTAYETAAALCERGELANLEHKLGKVYLRRGQWDLAQNHFQAALDPLDRDGDAVQPAHLFADWSLAAYHLGRIDRALELAQRALELSESADDRRGLAQTHNILGILARSRGEPETARRHLEQSLNLAEDLSDPGARVAALNNLALVHSDLGSVERALTLANEALELCVAYGDRHREAALHTNVADLLHAAGQSEAAMPHLKEAAVIFAEIGQDAGDWQPEIWKLVEW